jgi:anti-sigma regulatory factor (Ser/Thr protein kinase)
VRAIAHMKIRADLENLEKTRTFISECASVQHFSAARISEIELALEEAFANICNYAYAGEPGEIEVNCSTEDGGMVIEIIDSGTAFDITAVDDPDITADASERKIGGLGIFLIRELMDNVVYRREGGKNIVRLFVARES